jgi:hypothetical protein
MNVTRAWWWCGVEWVVVLVHLVIGDEGGEVVLVVDVEDRDGSIPSMG